MVNVKGRLNSRPFCVAMWSTGKDTQKPASAQLLPCLMGTRFRVGVAVGTMQRHKSRDIIRFFNLRSSKIKNIYMKPANGRQ